MTSFFFFFAIYIILINADKCSWDNCHKWNHSQINIHFISHTHNDLGWISTYDELYEPGPWRPSLRNTGVKEIINTIVYELNKNTTRRFSYSETDETLFTEQHHWHNHKGPACWESEYHLSCRDEPFVENEQQGKVNVDKILDKFVKYILSRIPTQKHRHFLVLMGDDFTHSVPDSFMLNLEKLIYYLNQKYYDIINAFFSTPSCYFKAINEIVKRKHKFYLEWTYQARF
uniref:Glycoside hydrolase family 38 N-terminal domain-containing protein n=1 Tax=Acrobeloides nanus TaxID=290746 RepID=A0A914C7M7_9BILA